MDAPEWQYLVPFSGSVAAALAQLRADLFTPDDYYWPHGGDRLKPTAEDELLSDGWILEDSTHSILDIFEVGVGDPADDDAYCKTFEVTDAECERALGTTRVTADDLARLDGQLAETLGHLLTGYGVGRHLIIYADGMPDQILFFGHSGD
ncbi:hypothetical protein [Dactylosporangium cerinum]